MCARTMGMPEKDAITQMIESAEANLISTTPGAVPPHVDDGGHLPFGGQVGGTRGPSAFASGGGVESGVANVSVPTRQELQ